MAAQKVLSLLYFFFNCHNGPDFELGQQKRNRFQSSKILFLQLRIFLTICKKLLAHTRENINGDIEKPIRFVVKKLTLMSWGI